MGLVSCATWTAGFRAERPMRTVPRLHGPQGSSATSRPRAARTRGLQRRCVHQPPVVLQATGELDAAGGTALRGPLLAACRTGAEVEVDLSRVTFIDSAGLGLLVAADRLLRREGRQLVLLAPHTRVRAVLDRLKASSPTIRE